MQLIFLFGPVRYYGILETSFSRSKKDYLSTDSSTLFLMNMFRMSLTAIEISIFFSKGNISPTYWKSNKIEKHGFFALIHGIQFIC